MTEKQDDGWVEVAGWCDVESRLAKACSDHWYATHGAGGSPTHSRFDCVWLCRLAYEDDSEALLRVAQAFFGRRHEAVVMLLHSPPVFFGSEFTCAGFVAYAGGCVHIVLRGSDKLDHWVRNLQCAVNEQGIHSGFDRYVDGVWQQIVDALLAISAEKQVNELAVCGHSLGGAAALIITHRLEQVDAHRKLSGGLRTVTFGAPRVGTERFEISSPLYRYRLSGDVVPYLPPRGFLNYFDVGGEYLIENEGIVTYKLDKSIFFRVMRIARWIEVLSRDSITSLVSEHRVCRYMDLCVTKSLRPFNWIASKKATIADYERIMERHTGRR